MNSTSFAELGGSLAVVEAGRTLLGCPGAPGCTTTGGLGSGCCAEIEIDKKTANETETKMPVNDRSLSRETKLNNCIEV